MQSCLQHQVPIWTPSASQCAHKTIGGGMCQWEMEASGDWAKPLSFPSLLVPSALCRFITLLEIMSLPPLLLLVTFGVWQLHASRININIVESLCVIEYSSHTLYRGLAFYIWFAHLTHSSPENIFVLSVALS